MIYGRRPRQLLVVWAILLALAALIYWFELSAPAFRELVRPFYWIIVAVAVFMTWRWFRGRSKKIGEDATADVRIVANTASRPACDNR